MVLIVTTSFGITTQLPYLHKLIYGYNNYKAYTC
jgi:hypothetical protein